MTTKYTARNVTHSLLVLQKCNLKKSNHTLSAGEDRQKRTQGEIRRYSTNLLYYSSE
jgi:hypothetical protein